MFLSFSILLLVSKAAKDEFDFFFLIFYELGASGSFFFFLSNLPIEAVDI